MQEHPSGSSESGENHPPSGPSEPAPRPLTIRDLEVRDQKRRDQIDQAERRDGVVRVFLIVVLVAVLGVAAFSWQSLQAHLGNAASDLDIVRITTEDQVTDVLRYAPLGRTRGPEGRRHLDTALADMASPDLSKRVAGVHAVRAITRRQFPTAEARVKREFHDLYEDFRNRHEDTEAVIRERSKGYRKAAVAYNQSAAAFPGALVRRLLGMPDKLPQLKP